MTGTRTKEQATAQAAPDTPARDADETTEIVLTHDVAAPREAVWRAWTDPMEVARWWGPEGFTTRVDELDLRVGGRSRSVMVGPDGAEYPVAGTFLEIVPGERFVATDEFDAGFDAGNLGDLPQAVVLTALFEDRGAGTRLTLRLAHPSAEDKRRHEAMGVVDGWRSSFACLDRYLASDEAAIRALVAGWSRALQAKDAAGLTAGYAPNALLFDAIPPYRTIGPDAIRSLWETHMPCFPARLSSQHRDLQVTVDGDVAFAHGLHRMLPVGEPHPCGDTWLRVTLCCRRIDGRWRVVHEHVSLPFDPETGKAAFIRDPEAAPPAAA